MDIGGSDIGGDGPIGKEGEAGGVMGGKSAKTVGVLVAFLPAFFAALFAASHLT